MHRFHQGEQILQKGEQKNKKKLLKLTWKKPYSSEAFKICNMVWAWSCPPRSIKGIVLPEGFVTLPGLHSSGWTKEGGTEEWTLDQLETSLCSIVSMSLQNLRDTNNNVLWRKIRVFTCWLRHFIVIHTCGDVNHAVSSCFCFLLFWVVCYNIKDVDLVL